MVSLLNLKKQIKGIQNTQKITKAMQLVAASKMQYFQKKALVSREYVGSLLNILANNISSFSEGSYNVQTDSKKVMFVLYSSDKGLCGPLNTKLFNTLKNSKKWIEAEDRSLVVIGKKAFNMAKINKIPVDKYFEAIPEKLDLESVLNISDYLIRSYLSQQYAEICMVVPHYVNSFTSYPVLKNLLPFTQEMLDSHLGPLDVTFQKKTSDFTIYEPSQEEFIDSLFENLIKSIFIQDFLQLKAAEYSSRMIAMQNATDAAKKMVKEKTLVMNKARQAAITQEIAELAGAKAAMEN